MQKRTALLFLLTFFTSGVFAQTSFQGIHIKAQLPNGWRVVQEDLGSILLGHNTTPGILLIAEHGFRTESDLLRSFSEGLQEEDVQLFPSGQAKKLANGIYAGKLKGFAGGAQAIGIVQSSISKTWNAGGVTVIALVREDLYNASYDQLVAGIMNSTRYLSHTTHPKSKEWVDYLGGSKLQSRSSYNTSTQYIDGAGIATGGYAGAGSSSSTTIHFCSSGDFGVNQYSSAYFGGTGVDGDVSSSNNESEGKWSVVVVNEQVIVRLAYTQDGEVEYYPVRYDKGYIISNDTKFTKDDSEFCR